MNVERIALLRHVYRDTRHEKAINELLDEIVRLMSKIDKIQEAVEDAQFIDNHWQEAKTEKMMILKVFNEH